MKRNEIMEEIRSTEEYYYDTYIEEVKLLLTCNNDIYCGYNTFDYSDEQIEENYNYFIDCMKKGLNNCEALILFNDYLQKK